MAELLVGVLGEAARIEAESLQRLAAAGESAEPIRSEVSIQHYERAPKDPAS
jgi:hypothetical protein